MAIRNKHGMSIVSIGIAIASCSVVPANTTIPPEQIASPSAQVTSASPTQEVRKTTLIKGLERPWSMTWLPDGSMLITEKAGRLRIVRNGKLEPNAIAGVPPVLSANQAGLMDVSPHPQFAKKALSSV